MNTNILTEKIGKELAIAYETKNGRCFVPFKKGEVHHGYDIKTFDEVAQQFRYIELKTSRKAHMINRWLEEHEQRCLTELPSYYIYYILDINTEACTGKVIEFSAKEWQEYYKKAEKKYWYSFPKNTGLDKAVEIKV